MAYIERSRPRSWREVLWLLMTAAGVLLLVCAALSV
jgi:drug/metabolite transporter (DMT)-like permease